jgi:hypothetical protein
MLRTSTELLHSVWTLRQRLAGPEFSQYQRLVSSYPEVRGQPASPRPGSTTRALQQPPARPHWRFAVPRPLAGPHQALPSPHRQRLQFCAKLQRRFLEHPVTEMKLDKVRAVQRATATPSARRLPLPLHAPRPGGCMRPAGACRAGHQHERPVKPFSSLHAAARGARGPGGVQLHGAGPSGAAAAGLRPSQGGPLKPCVLPLCQKNQVGAVVVS